MYTVGLYSCGCRRMFGPQSLCEYDCRRNSPIVQFAASDNSFVPRLHRVYRSDIRNINNPAMDIHRSKPFISSVANPGSVCYPVGEHLMSDLQCLMDIAPDQINEWLIHVVNCSYLPQTNFISSDTTYAEAPAFLCLMALNAVSWQWLFWE